MIRRGLIAFGLVASSAVASPLLMTPAEFQSLPITKSDARVRYGQDANNFGDLRLPKGKGPFPLAVLIHGGCFRADFAKLDELSQFAEALRRDGIATRNIEYRRLGQRGGGWPGMYLDVGQGIDYVRKLARRYPLDIAHVVVIGHSAGGHLAHWSASRAAISSSSAIFAKEPVKPFGIVNLAGLPDLRQNVSANEKACGRPVNHEILGGQTGILGENGRASAPSERLPLRVKQTIVLGEFDDSVPRAIAEDYVTKARAAGDDTQIVLIQGVGHFEIAASTSSAWPAVRQAILVSLALEPN